MDPAFAMAVCRYDLTGGSIKLTVPASQAYTSVSFYTRNDVAYYAINDRSAGRKVIELDLMTEAQHAELPEDEDVTAADRLIIDFPDRDRPDRAEGAGARARPDAAGASLRSPHRAARCRPSARQAGGSPASANDPSRATVCAADRVDHRFSKASASIVGASARAPAFLLAQWIACRPATGSDPCLNELPNAPPRGADERTPVDASVREAGCSRAPASRVSTQAQTRSSGSQRDAHRAIQPSFFARDRINASLRDSPAIGVCATRPLAAP